MEHCGAIEQAIAVVVLTVQILRPGIAVVTKPFTDRQLPAPVARAMNDGWIRRVLIERTVNYWSWFPITLVDCRNNPVFGCCFWNR